MRQFLCSIGFHDWLPWVDCVVSIRATAASPWERAEGQERRCKVCGKCVIRHVGE